MDKFAEVTFNWPPKTTLMLCANKRVRVTDHGHRLMYDQITEHKLEEVIRDEGGFFILTKDADAAIAGVGYEYDEEEGVWWYVFDAKWLAGELA